jgi:hypothetical protein
MMGDHSRRRRRSAMAHAAATPAERERVDAVRAVCAVEGRSFCRRLLLAHPARHCHQQETERIQRFCHEENNAIIGPAAVTPPCRRSLADPGRLIFRTLRGLDFAWIVVVCLLWSLAVEASVKPASRFAKTLGRLVQRIAFSFVLPKPASSKRRLDSQR